MGGNKCKQTLADFVYWLSKYKLGQKTKGMIPGGGGTWI